MKRGNWSLLFAWTFSASLAAQASGYMQVAGRIVTSHGVPISGCAVQLFGDPGPSAIVVSGPEGDFFFAQVPTNVPHLYTLRVTCGPQVIYQGLVQGPGFQPPIVIPVQ